MSLHLTRAIEGLKKQILGLSAKVEESVFKAFKALQNNDKALALEVIKYDEKIDALEVEIEEQCLETLALHQPVAIDLRFIVAILKINNDLERIGDFAVSMAQRANALSDILPSNNAKINFEDIARKVHDILHLSLEAFVNLDEELAKKVIASDHEIDRINKEIHLHVLEECKKSPEKIESLTLQLSVSRNLERMADHATNIAEDVIYMIRGKIVRHKKID